MPTSLYRRVSLTLAIIACLTIGYVTNAADIAVIVNPDSGISSLNADEVSALFMGKMNAFPNGKFAAPFNQPEGGLRSNFGEKVLHKDGNSLRAYWAKAQFTGKASPPKEVAGDAEMKKAVNTTPGGIGYIDKGAVDGSVKVIATF